MATNLVILYPQIQFEGTLINDPDDDGINLAAHTINGGRRDHYKNFSAVTTSQFDYLYPGLISPDFYLYARADLIKDQDSGTVSVKLIGSASSTFSSPSTVSNTLSTANLYGPNSEDFLAFPVSPGSYRYWRGEIATTASFKHEFSKFWAGVAFDFGVDPYFPRRIQRTSTGLVNRRPQHNFTFKWSGITNEKREEFNEKINKFRDTNSVFLATRTYHDVLNEYRLIHCWIRDARWTAKVQSLNDLEIQFEEAL